MSKTRSETWDRNPGLPQLFAATAGGIALLAWVGWLTGARILAGQWQRYGPMAPSTALAFLLLAGAQFYFARSPALRLSRLFALTATIIVSLLSVLVLAQFIAHFDLGLERALSRTDEFLDSTPLGRMSPLAAAAFLLESAALLFLLIGQRWRHAPTAAALLAAGVTGVNTVALVGYMYGAPLLYSERIIAVALPAAIAFVLLGVGQISLAVPGVPALRGWSRVSMRGILLRAFLPFMLLFVLIQGLLDLTIQPVLSLNPAVWQSLIALTASILIVVVIGWTARRTGSEIERTQETLAESEGRYRDLVEHSHDLICTHDLAGNILSVNPAAMRITGYSEEELLRMNLRDVLVPAARDRFADYLAEIKTKGSAQGLMLVQTKRGEKRIWEYDNTLRTAGVAVPIVRGTARDVTERERAEEALHASEVRYRVLFDNASIGIGVVDAEGNLLVFNDAILKPGGYTRADMRQIRNVAQLYYDPADRARILARVREQGYLDRHETRFKRKDGTPYDARLSLKPITLEGKPAMLAITEDITERKRAEDELIKLRKAVEATGEAVFLTDKEGTITFVNPEFTRLYGYAAAEVVGKVTPRILKSGLLSQSDYQMFWQALLSKQIVKTEVVNKTRDGRLINVEVSANPVLDEHENIMGFLAIEKDITARKRADEALRASEARYRSLFENMLEGFAYCRMIFEDNQPQDFVYLEVNHAFEKLTGLKGVAGKKVTEVIPGIRASNPELFEIYGRVALTGKPERFETFLPALGIWFSISVYSPAKDHFIAVFDNITERKRAEEELRRRAQQFELLYVTALDLTAPHELPVLLPIIVERAAKLLNAPEGGMYLVDSVKPEVRCVVSYNTPHDYTGTVLQLGEGAAGTIAQTGKPLIIDDYRVWSGRAGAFEGEPFSAVMGVPMISRGRVIGVLHVLDNMETRRFTPSDQELLMLLANQAVVAIENARLLDETRARAAEFAALYETTRDLAAQTDLPALLQTILDRALHLLNSAQGAIYQYDAARDDVELVTGAGIPVALGTRLKLGEGVGGRVTESRASLIVEDYQTWEHRSPQYHDVRFRAVIGVPLTYSGERLGALVLAEMGESARKFTDADAVLISLFAAHAAGAVHSARLFDETRARSQQLGLLYDAGLTLNRELDPRVQREFLLKIALTAVHADRAELFLYDAEKQRVQIHADIGFTHEIQERLKMVYSSVLNEDTIVGWVIKNRLPLYAPNLSDEPRYVPLEPEVRAGLWVPIEHEKEILGVLGVKSTHLNAFSPQDERLLILFANQISAAMDNARLFAESKQHAAEMGALHETALDLVSHLERQPLLEAIVRRAAGLLRGAGGLLYRWEEPSGQLRCVVSQNLSYDYTNVTLKPGEGMAGRVYQTAQPLIVNDYARWEGRAAHLRDVPSQAIISVPIIWQNQVIGVINISDESGERTFDDHDARLLALFANQAAVAMENARLFDETRARADQQAALHEISAHLALSHDPLEMCDIVARALHGNLGYLFVSVQLRDRATNDRIVPAYYGDNIRPTVTRLAPGEGLSEKAFRTGELQYWRDVTREPRYIPTDPPCACELDVPFKSGDTVMGIIVIEDVRVDAFDQDDFNVIQAVANQLGIALENARLLDETRQQIAELEAVNQISTALRAAQTLEEMLPRLLDETLAVLNTSAGNIWLYDPDNDQLLSAIARGWVSAIAAPTAPREGIVGHVFATGQAYHSREVKQDPRLRESVRPQVPVGWGSVAVPIRFAQGFVGVIFVAWQLPREIAPAEVTLLTTVAEIAGNAIHRMRLLAETQNRIERLQALREVDSAITGSLDLKLILSILLDKVTTQLRVDAASILLLDPHTNRLAYAAGKGFRSKGIESSSLRVGEGIAGRAALERRTLHANLAEIGQGFVHAQLLKADAFVAYYAVPLIVKGKVRGVLDLFNRAPLDPDEGWLDFLEALGGQAAIAIDNATLFADLQKSNLGLGLAYESTIEGWSRALDLRDKETEGHTQRVTAMTLRLAQAMGIAEAELAQIRRGGLLHDIGKMGVPDAVLLKPGALTPDEWELMRQHPVFAYELLAPIAYLRDALDIPYCHHEKWDGTGYPRGLQGEAIPLSARIFAVVDVYDAVTSDRPYRQAWSHARALEHIRGLAGTHFDPRVVEMFLRIVEEGN